MSYLGNVREVKGYFKPSSKLITPVKETLVRMGLDELDDSVVGGTRVLHFDGQYAKDLSDVKSYLGKKFPRLKLTLSESSDEDQTMFDEFDVYDFETLTMEA